ncbi:MAG: ArsC/Spx/MgsR family protein [Flavobacteriaceae bacterium]
MDTIYYLSTCDSCRRILKELEPLGDVNLIDIKTHPLTSTQLDEMRQLAGSYEALFSKRARLYRERGLNKQELAEEDYRALILEHYTFLKRPVMLFGENIYIGNSTKVVVAAKESLHT